MLVSEATSRLAGRLDGVHYSDRGRVHLKNIADPVHVIRVYSEHEAAPRDGWRVRIFGRPGRSLGWRLAAAVVLVAAACFGTLGSERKKSRSLFL